MFLVLQHKIENKGGVCFPFLFEIESNNLANVYIRSMCCLSPPNAVGNC